MDSVDLRWLDGFKAHTSQNLEWDKTVNNTPYKPHDFRVEELARLQAYKLAVVNGYFNEG